MTIPPRGRTGHGVYFITSSTYMKMPLLQSERSARLFLDVLLGYRERGKFLLHEFVVMPNHIHLLLTPSAGLTLERCIQLIKGGYSYRRKKDLGSPGEIWQKSYYDHRVRDWAEYARLRRYIHQNPVRRGLVRSAEEFPYSSACAGFALDEVPQWLKPVVDELAVMHR